MLWRILSSFGLIISILFFPFWVSLIFAIAGIIYFNFFWEVLVIFFLSDLIFGFKEIRFYNLTLVSTLIIILCLFIIEFIKKKTRLHDKK